MSTDTLDSLNGIVGQAAHFAGDYLFKAAALPNNASITSEEHTLNNTLGRLQLTGTIDTPLTIAAEGHLTITLQNKAADGSWEKYADVLSANNQVLSAGQVFAMIPTPDDTKRIFRLVITTDFDASAAKLTATVEALPLA